VGIPKRLERRTKATYAIVLSSGDEVEAHMADYLLLSKEQELPPAGSLGANLKNMDSECVVSSLISGGAGEKAGLHKGDILIAINAQPVKTVADVHLALWDKAPGDRVRVEVRRKRRLRPPSTQDLEVQLAAAAKMPE
jgi:S1-C subfamily serine protease